MCFVRLNDGNGAPAFHVVEAAMLVAHLDGRAEADPPGGPRFRDPDGSHLDKWDVLGAPASE